MDLSEISLLHKRAQLTKSTTTTAATESVEDGPGGWSHTVGAPETRSHDADLAVINRLIAQREWGRLREADQLRSEHARKRALPLFTEGELSYPPTFKLSRQPGWHYDTKR